MTKNKDKPAWLETIKLTNRAFRIYYENSPVQTIVYDKHGVGCTHPLYRNIFVRMYNQ